MRSRFAIKGKINYTFFCHVNDNFIPDFNLKDNTANLFSKQKMFL